jgi:hypothetical protein
MKLKYLSNKNKNGNVFLEILSDPGEVAVFDCLKQRKIYCRLCVRQSPGKIYPQAFNISSIGDSHVDGTPVGPAKG